VLPEWVFNDLDRGFMALALEEARAAAARGEVPVGCVLVRDRTVVARTGNRRQELADPTAHAEVLALRAGGATLSDWRLGGCALYVTLEPCPMCVAACRQARLGLLVWGARDPISGACGSAVDLAEEPRLGPPLAHRGGLEEAACGELLRAFFAKTRRPS
jgi:tRNA(adenine34) deaminase